MENSKLNRNSLLVENSLQTQCQNTLRYPAVVWRNLYSLNVSNLDPPSLMCSSFYIPSILTSLVSYAATHITDMSPCDALMMPYSFRWELTCMHTTVWVEILCSENVLVCPCSNFLKSEIATQGVYHDVYIIATISSNAYEIITALVQYKSWI